MIGQTASVRLFRRGSTLFARSAANREESARGSDSEMRLRQLRVVHDELNRQRDATAAKHATMYQRATLLIGAATVVTGVQSARLPLAIQRLVAHAAAETTVTPEIALNIASLALALIAAGAGVASAIGGIRTLWVERGSEIDVEKFAVNVLNAQPNLYATEWSLLADKLGVHAEDNRRLEAKRKTFMVGASLLVVAWIAAIVQFATSV